MKPLLPLLLRQPSHAPTPSCQHFMPFSVLAGCAVGCPAQQHYRAATTALPLPATPASPATTHRFRHHTPPLHFAAHLPHIFLIATRLLRTVLLLRTYNAFRLNVRAGFPTATHIRCCDAVMDWLTLPPTLQPDRR